MPERILYGVQGEGRGHAARSMQVIQWLADHGHQVRVLTGGDAMQVLRDRGFDIFEIPQLRCCYRADGTLARWRTIRGYGPRALGLLFGIGASFRQVAELVDEFRPDLLISDFEPYLSRLAGMRGIPLLAINHQHFLIESVLPPLTGWRKKLSLKLHQLGISLLVGQPDRIITSSFFHFPRKSNSRAVFVGTFIPDRLGRLEVRRGDSVVVYLKQPGLARYLVPHLAARPHRRFLIFSDWRGDPPENLPGHVRLAPIDRERFLWELARCRALVTTAGNQAIGEAIFLGKPVLAFPEPGQLEQELNALALDRSGLGESFDIKRFSAETWDRFEARETAFRANIERHMRSRRPFDGRAEALRAVRRFLRETGSGAGHHRRDGVAAREPAGVSPSSLAPPFPADEGGGHAR